MSKKKYITKAIIPIAGNGTRMYPETHFIKKVMLPVIDSNGAAKPALMFMLEELSECGIEDIYLIVGEDEEDYYNKVFEFDYNEAQYYSLPASVRDYYSKIYELGKSIRIVIQREKKGFGHAVFQAREHLNSEPTILLLGDFIYRSKSEISCTQQAIDAFVNSGGKSVVGVKAINVSDSSNYGIIHGVFRDDYTNLIDVDEMVEKPSEEYSREKLLINGLCYSTFGSYVLTDEIFECLNYQIQEKEKNNIDGEIDLTGALVNSAKKGRLIGAAIYGESFDVGLPRMYYDTFVELGKSSMH